MIEPQGEVTIQTIAMPKDTNANGDIFGGWLLSQMDLASGVLGKKISRGRVATVAIESMTFIRPVQVGDLVSCRASLVRSGRTSLTMQVEVWVERYQPDQVEKVAKGIFVVVAIDDTGKPRPIDSYKIKK